MANDGRETQAVQEPLIAQFAFKGTESDRADVVFIAFWNEETDAEVMRRFFDFEGLRAEAARCRAARDAQKAAASAA
jgi:hypothetical protein